MAFEYTVRQCAQKLGVSEVRIHQLIRSGALPAEMIAGRYFVDEDAVNARAEAAPGPGRPSKKGAQDPKRFSLMNREHEVLDFVYDDRHDEFIEVTRITDPSRAPLGLISPHGRKVSLSALTYWWRHRSIPISRFGIQAKLAEFGLSDPARLPFASLGLSLSDQYWIRPEGTRVDWRSINFFTNPIPEMSAGDWLKQVGLDSPDNTSEGQLSKRWIWEGGTTVLAKGGGPLDQEPYNEVIATHLHQRLLASDDFVPYRLDRLADGSAISLCDNFLNDDEEYIPAYYVMKTMPRSGGRDAYRHYLECCSRLGVDGAETALAKTIVTDDLLGNTDRHLRNFGLIRNVETLEYRPAPIFDTGNSLLFDKTEAALADGDLLFTTKPFSDDPNQQLRLVNDYSWFDAGALEGFADEAAVILCGNSALERRAPYVQQLIERRVERLRVIAS